MKMFKILTDLKFINCKSDPCLFKKEKFYIGFYVDEIFIVGSKVVCEQFINDIQSIIKVIKYDNVFDFVGSQLIWNSDKTQVILHQSKLALKLINKFKTELYCIKVPITPGVPSLIISTPNKDERLIDDDSQTRYRSAVGSILYLVKLVDQIYLIYQENFLKL